MATFNFGSHTVDSDDPDFVQKAESAIVAAGGTVSGSLVFGNQHGHSGGVLNGDVVMGDDASDRTRCEWIPGDAIPSCDFDPDCPEHGVLCGGCGQPENDGRVHGLNQGYGGCV